MPIYEPARLECKIQTSMRGCLVHFIGPEAEHTEYLSDMVAKLKVDDISSSPVWECFHNMSAVGASTEALFHVDNNVIKVSYEEVAALEDYMAYHEDADVSQRIEKLADSCSEN